ncbi:MAG TPA: hypothetical protein VIV60_17350 [Polyangiaceae bacterium]
MRNHIIESATLLLCATTLTLPSHARGIVRNPGEHPHYGVELEPHLVLDWAGAPGPNADGFGAGFRASIPLFHNGPISTINNNMAISFGFDWSRASHACGPWREAPRPGWVDDCTIDSFWFPVALQWNFFLTDIISVFGEPGLAIVHYRWDRWQRCWAPGYCDANGRDTRLQPVFWGGVRFLVSDSIGITLRIGYPSITAGVSFLL